MAAPRAPAGLSPGWRRRNAWPTLAAVFRGARLRFVLLGCAVAAGCAEPARVRWVAVDEAVPGVDGAALVAFWATWCPPCVEETPALVELAREAAPELAVVIVSHDAGEADVASYFGGPPPPPLRLRMDEGHALGRSLQVTSLPTSYLVVDGRAIARFDGPRDWASSGMQEALSRMVTEARARRARAAAFDSAPTGR